MAVEIDEPMVQLNAVRPLGVALMVGCALTIKLTGRLKGELDAEESVIATLPV